MSRPSTQAQRAIAAQGDCFLNQLKMLLKKHGINHNLNILYRSALYMYAKPLHQIFRIARTTTL